MTESEPILSKLLRSVRKGATPQGEPRDSAVPPPGRRVLEDVDMRIDRRGAWHYEGSPIGRPELVKLFADVLRRDAASDHWLITPAEACRIRVDDAPFVAVDCECRNPGPDQEIVLRTNVDAFVTVDADHPIRVEIDPQTAEPAPYVGLGNSLEAKIARPVFYELVDLGVRREQDGRSVIGVWSKSVFFELGDMGGDDE